MNIRDKFPFFKNNPNIIYLDSASTTQKPSLVTDKTLKYLIKTANPGKSNSGLSFEVNNEIEATRTKIANFFGVSGDNLAFTSGATAGMNLISQSIGKQILKEGDEVLICNLDHNATILPWLSLKSKSEKLGIIIKKYKLDPFTGLVDLDSFLNQISEKTKFVILTHAHNIYGGINPINEIVKKIPTNVIKVLDMSQTVGHTEIDFNDLGVDIGLFSGHKMFSLEGVGAILTTSKSKELFKQVAFGSSLDTKKFPHLLEIGTKNTSSILSLGFAIDFINEIGLKNIEKNIENLTKYLIQELQKISLIEFMPGAGFNSKMKNTGIVSFNLYGEKEKLESILSENLINIRTGKHCVDGIADSFRISLHAYNSAQDIDRLISCLKQF